MNFGRLKAPDQRDRDFPLRAVMKKTLVPRPASKYWGSRWVGNQGDTSQCVGYSWHGFLRASPTNTREPQPAAIYAGAQSEDEFPGPPPDYDGSSVRGGAKFLTNTVKQVQEYRWAYSIETVLDWLATKGPMVFGSDWVANMMEPDKRGFIHANGSIVGGHAYLVLGYSEKLKALRIQNSWGKEWGQSGRCWLSYDDATALLKADGEACCAIEKAKA